MLVLGAGLSRTGTFSLKSGLEQLGFGPCLHGYHFYGRPQLIRAWIAAKKSPESADWDQLLDGFNSAVDLPVAAFWREIYAHDPDLKVVLSVRDEDAWYDSIRETLFRWAIPSYPRLSRAWLRLLRSTSGWLPPFPALGAEVMIDRVFKGQLDRESAIQTYRQHNQDVIATIPADHLLVWRASDGWEPLCAFLGVPVPDSPFPRTNDRSVMAADRRAWPKQMAVHYATLGRRKVARLLGLSRASETDSTDATANRSAPAA